MSLLALSVMMMVMIVFMLCTGLGYLGAALATCISLWLQFFTLLVYIVYLKVSSESHQYWSFTCLLENFQNTARCIQNRWRFYKQSCPEPFDISSDIKPLKSWLYLQAAELHK